MTLGHAKKAIAKTMCSQKHVTACETLQLVLYDLTFYLYYNPFQLTWKIASKKISHQTANSLLSALTTTTGMHASCKDAPSVVVTVVVGFAYCLLFSK